MPRCKHCLGDLKNYFNFKRHFAGRHCPVSWLARNGTEQPVPAQSGPLTQESQREPSVAAPVVPSGTPVLPVQSTEPSSASGSHRQTDAQCADLTPIQAVADLKLPRNEWLKIFHFPHIKTMLKHKCVVCSQWLANIRSVKLHMRKVHPEVYHGAGEKAAADCSKLGHIVSPCKYCDMQVTRTDQHSKTCPVLWQARLCFLADSSTPGATIGSLDHGGDGRWTRTRRACTLI